MYILIRKCIYIIIYIVEVQCQVMRTLWHTPKHSHKKMVSYLYRTTVAFFSRYSFAQEFLRIATFISSTWWCVRCRHPDTRTHTRKHTRTHAHTHVCTHTHTHAHTLQTRRHSVLTARQEHVLYLKEHAHIEIYISIYLCTEMSM